ncbi:MAG TPA: L-seryl-tRNA(Sec) selenium transferase [Polyangia bacterium]|nr:L-seryl-tRNA(Sec) selenium transferase [Polyangia bacterium]
MQPPADLNAALRQLPKVDEVLASPSLRDLLERVPRWAVVAAVRDQIDELRAELVAARQTTPPTDAQTPGEIAVNPARVAAAVAALLAPSLQPVINATGVVLHTNLGRAPLAEAAVQRVADVARGYCNLEYQLDARRRGSRHDHVAALLATLTGAEDALVVNNCAGAVLLALSQLAGTSSAARGVVVSRGELVEIGGSFRVPDVMRASGATLVEVGTTNRTHARDYEGAIVDGETALLLKVHRSNFAIVGFTHEVTTAELAAIGRARDVPTMVDLGSGALADLNSLGDAANEPRVQDVVAAGADLVTFSGDKLLGGPQAGILVGKRAHVQAMRSHPLLRALRPDKLTLAALEATLELYRDGKSHDIPALAMLATPEPTLQARAVELAALCSQAAPALTFTPARVRSAVGGGALPTVEPWSWAVAVSAVDISADALDARLRAAKPPVVGRIAADRLLLDVRTVGDAHLPAVARAFEANLG